MADTTQVPVNGNYPAHNAYPADSYAAVNNANNNYHPTQSSTPTNPPPANESKNEIPKDEVGWYFVEQYYTTMSRSPEKLHLFYSRRSQFVFGNEAESVPVVVGQKAIQEKIRELDFHDCKVRVLNVDSQASFDNILVSVIGEISNRSEPSRKFVQTFVLAEQPNGYYVLNDIFRYLADEDEEFVEQAPPAEAPAASQDAAVANAEPQPEKQAVEAQVDTQAAAPKVDEKPEVAAPNGEPQKAPEPAPQTNGSAVQPEKPAVPVTPAVPVVPAEPEAVKPEVPKTQEPTPAATQAAPAPEKEAPPAKAAPKTWANIASKNGAGAASVATPVVPVSQPKPAAAPASTAQQQQSQQPQQDQQPAAAATTATTENAANQQSSNDGSGWQTAGHENKRQSRAGDEQKFPAYIKNVTEKVDAALLKSTLAKFGKILYFDVNRQKNCAFVDFADQAAYNAAVAANPHQIGSEQIYVEERRIRPNNYGNGYGAGRGGAGRGRGDGRAGSQGRGGFQRDSGRGGFAPRGRAGNVAPKGRSQPQAA